VILPSAAQPGDALVLIDQTNSALIWVDPTHCAAQHDLSVATGFYADPTDLVGISTTKAYVPRYLANAMPSGMPGAFDEGNDLLIINPTTQTITGRIDLSSYATAANGGSALVASPTRALLANGLVYVVLGNISADDTNVGPGVIAIVDPETDTVTGTIELPTAKSCSQLAYVEATHTLVVVCSGDYNQPLATQAAQSVVASYDISGATPQLLHAVAGTTLGGRSIVNTLVAAVTENDVIVATYGDIEMSAATPPATPDQLWYVNLAAGTATKLEDADGSLVLGSALYIPSQQEVLVADAGMSAPKLTVLDVSTPGTATVVNASIVPDPKAGLPPRYIAWY
jgi:hypothetical protein